MEKDIKVWYDAEGDYLEVLFEKKGGFFRETENDAVMEKVDDEGKIIGFSILNFIAIKRGGPISISLRSDKTRNTYLGLIAQEFQELIPEIVSTGDDAEKTLGMRYAELVPVLIKAIQEQQAIIETLKSQNAASNEKTEKLNKEIEAIKARLGLTAKVEK